MKLFGRNKKRKWGSTVMMNGIYYAHLNNKIYSYQSGNRIYSGERNLRASTLIFQ